MPLLPFRGWGWGAPKYVISVSQKLDERLPNFISPIETEPDKMKNGEKKIWGRFFARFSAAATPRTRPATTLITPSVEEFNYTTLLIVFSGPLNGRGRTRIGFSLLDREN